MLDFSIVIPTFERPAQLKHCLESIASLNYDRERFEVIVVDDQSRNSPREIVDSLKDRVNIRLIVQDHAGPATARNRGAAESNGRMIVFTDDDCALAPDWLAEIAAATKSLSGGGAGGHTINALTENIYAQASQTLIDYLYEYYNTAASGATFFTSNNMALPAEQFHRIGGFDSSFRLTAGEDRELCDRWLHNHLTLVYVPSAKIYHSHHLTLRKFWRQHFNYGRGARHFHMVRASRNQTPVKIEPPAFYAKLILFPWTRFRFPRAFTISALLAIAQVANAAGFFWGKNSK